MKYNQSMNFVLYELKKGANYFSLQLLLLYMYSVQQIYAIVKRNKD
jgi:hypothetical protein